MRTRPCPDSPTVLQAEGHRRELPGEAGQGRKDEPRRRAEGHCIGLDAVPAACPTSAGEAERQTRQAAQSAAPHLRAALATARTRREGPANLRSCNLPCLSTIAAGAARVERAASREP